MFFGIAGSYMGYRVSKKENEKVALEAVEIRRRQQVSGVRCQVQEDSNKCVVLLACHRLWL